MHPFHKRLAKEYKELKQNKLPGVRLVDNNNDLTHFIFRVQIKDNEVYPPLELYHLYVDITKEYPVDSPRVQFIIYDQVPLDEDEDDEVQVVEGIPKIPMHPHVYSNGHICLNLLGEDWTPACSIEPTILSIQSMLAANHCVERPPDDAQYVRHAPKDPKQTSFSYHDNDV